MLLLISRSILGGLAVNSRSGSLWAICVEESLWLPCTLALPGLSSIRSYEHAQKAFHFGCASKGMKRPDKHDIA